MTNSSFKVLETFQDWNYIRVFPITSSKLLTDVPKRSDICCQLFAIPLPTTESVVVVNSYDLSNTAVISNIGRGERYDLRTIYLRFFYMYICYVYLHSFVFFDIFNLRIIFLHVREIMLEEHSSLEIRFLLVVRLSMDNFNYFYINLINTQLFIGHKTQLMRTRSAVHITLHWILKKKRATSSLSTNTFPLLSVQ